MIVYPAPELVSDIQSPDPVHVFVELPTEKAEDDEDLATIFIKACCGGDSTVFACATDMLVQ